MRRVGDVAAVNSRSRHYGRGFYSSQMAGSYTSAKLVLKALFDAYQPESVVDFGCGIGTWLRAARELGVSDVLGLDGPHVDRSLLQIQEAEFIATDLSAPTGPLPRRYDMAISVEVAEHLKKDRASGFVAEIASSADVVLFSAAIPGQTGRHHINEQFPSYWIALFETHGFKCYDLLRPQIWNEPDVEVWYRQNTLLFSRYATFDGQRAEPGSYDVVHPEVWMSSGLSVRKFQGFAREIASRLVPSNIRRIIRGVR